MIDDARRTTGDGTGPAPQDDAALDPAESLRLIRAQQDRARDLTPDGRVVYGTWGVAWLVGYGALWFSVDNADSAAGAWAFVLFGTLVLAAIATTVVHTTRRSRGIAGPSAQVGTLYGIAWGIAFTAMSVTLGGLATAGASPDVVGLAANAMSCLVVGMLYFLTALVWGDRRVYVLGAWILLVGAVSPYVGYPGSYLLLATAAGGGFLVMAGAEVRAARRRAATGG
ncbi:hypothetical protein CLV28_0998 [Sediminihabitans luteus]|uniref:Uncharacterized protein n=1 Tax=Sediminihabitans luteus TaxID=1138585 RepID=A0A2M9D0Q5_9CELL|nr:hypothetical protein [Sediminihabitans luteus]PJJ77772.1 hypothetical protein CLV28_0998 [Sediminihabitans luteus]GIJ00001.1 hypothetical protein Slu03_23780 [Sediminihabitans luteus]